MESGTLHRLITVVQRAFALLNHPLPLPALEPACIIIHRIMSYQTRQFHTMKHIFSFIDDDSDAHTILAAVFHDLVYFQVDDGIPPTLHDLCYESVVLREGRMFLRTDHPADSMLELAVRLFGLRHGQELTILGGLNEFLSALLFLKMFEDELPLFDLVAVTLCIEASVPFRDRDSAGRSVAEALEARLVELAHETIPPSTHQALVARAIRFANRDVRDFQLPEPDRFLNNTWKLMPETNPALRFPGSFTVHEYRVALGRMLGFFRFLKPTNVFHTAPGLDVDLEALAARASSNLAISAEYLEIKLLAVSLIEAVAEVTGGDAPMSLFMGDIAHDGDTWATMESYLPAVPPASGPLPTWLDPQSPVYHLLAVGRVEESAFDLRHSPLATYLYLWLDPTQRAALIQRMHEFFAGTLWAEPYLLLWPSEPRRVVVSACERIASTRREALAAWTTR